MSRKLQIVLILSLTLTFFVALACASNATDLDTIPTEYTYNQAYDVGSVVETGSCGENIQYELICNGVYTDYVVESKYNSRDNTFYDHLLKWNHSTFKLNIFGTGKMYDWKGMSYEDDPLYMPLWSPESSSSKRICISANRDYNHGIYSVCDVKYTVCPKFCITEINFNGEITHIGDLAFGSCSCELYPLEDVVLPNTIKTIGKSAFFACPLKTIILPNSVTRIGESAFQRCSSLKLVELSNSLTRIDAYAFYDDCALETVNIPNSVTILQKYAFYCCKSLHTVKISNSLEGIPERAFTCCALQEINIPESVRYIGEAAFASCDSLKKIELNDSVNFQDHVFSSCGSLETIKIPDQSKFVDSGAFANCRSLKNVEFTNSVTGMFRATFMNCESLEKINIPKGITEIGDSTFEGCSSLKSVEILDSVLSISENAFKDSGLESVEIPNSVVSIGNDAFRGSEGLKKIVLGEGISNIGSGAFYNNSGVADIYFNCEPPNISDKAFKININLGENCEPSLYFRCDNVGWDNETISKWKNEYIDNGNFEFLKIKEIHKNGDFINEVKPTCQRQGYSLYKCKACQKEYKLNIIEKLKHIVGDYLKTVEPTCEEQGYTLCKCKDCQEQYKTNIVEKLGHNKYYVQKVNPTCCNEGLNAHYACRQCEKMFIYSNGKYLEKPKSELEIPKLSHSYTTTDAKEPTCLETGNIKYKTCSSCHGVFDESYNQITLDDTVLAAKGHSISKVAKHEPTCYLTGHEEYWKCQACKKCFSDENGENEITLKEVEIPSYGGHDYITVPAKAATCTDSGNKEYAYCSRCVCAYWADSSKLSGYNTGTKSEALEITYISAKGHNVVHQVAEEPTCTQDGHIERWKCSRCSDEVYLDSEMSQQVSIDETIIPATGHSLEFIEAKVETCTNAGNYKHWKCNNCENLYKDANAQEKTTLDQVTISAHHTLIKTEAVTPTCQGPGNYPYYKCEKCNNIYKDADGKNQTTLDESTRKQTGHSIKNIIAKEPTCTNEGCLQHYECSYCGTVYSNQSGTEIIDRDSVYIPAKGHNLAKVNAKAPTCTEPGNQIYWSCSRCNEAYIVNQSGVVKTSVEDVSIPAIGHRIELVNAKNPTCIEDGCSKHYECANCGNVYFDSAGTFQLEKDDVKISALGHSMVHFESKQPTYLKDGNIEYWKCDVCDGYFKDVEGTNSFSDNEYVISRNKKLMDKIKKTSATNLKLSEKKKKIQITWKFIDLKSQTQYEVYRSLKKKSGFKKIGTIKNNTKKYTDSKLLKKGKKYYYKIIAKVKIENKWYKSKASVVKNIKYK